MLYVCIAAHLGARHARADPANACHQRCFVQSVSTNVRFQIGIFSRTKLEVNCRVADFIVKPRTWTLQSGYHKMFRYIKHFWAIFSQDWPISNLQKIRSSQGWRQSSANHRCKGRIPCTYLTMQYYCYDTSTLYYLYTVMILMICFYICWKSISCQHVPCVYSFIPCLLFSFIRHCRSRASRAWLWQAGRGDTASFGRDGMPKGPAFCGQMHQHLWDSNEWHIKVSGFVCLDMS